MEAIELEIEPRASAGKGAARAVRRNGRIPAILYGSHRAPVAISVGGKEFTGKMATGEGSRMIQLKTSDASLDAPLVLVKEIQRHPVSGEVTHIDFCAVDIKKKHRIAVPVHLVGKAKGVEEGGILQLVRRDVEVSCLPMSIPEFVEVDVSGLAIHDAIHASEIPLPPGVQGEFEKDFTMVTVLAPTVEQVETPEEGEEGEAGEEGAEGAAEEPQEGEEAVAKEGQEDKKGNKKEDKKGDKKK